MSKSRFRAATAASVSAALALSAAVAPVPAFADTAAPAASPVVINEVESNGDPVADWVELANTDNNNRIDISGWKIVDNDDKHAPIVIPDGTTIESGGYFSVYTEGAERTPDKSAGFGLGGKDSVRVFDAAGKLVAEYSWTEHAATTWGRIPDKTGEFANTGEPTRGMPNKSAEDIKPVHDEPWPFDPQDIADVDLGGDFEGEDMSGIDFDANGRAWIVNNGESKLYAVDYDAEAKKYTLAGTWVLRYPDGTGQPDSEGITVGADGALYVATERNNEKETKGTSRPSVLRFEVPTGEGELKATHEWNLSEVTGEIGANAGWEAIEYIPEQKVYALGLEANGKVYFVDLKMDGTHALKQEYQSPFKGVMALDYNAKKKQLRVLCDEACDGASLLLAHDGKQFAPVSKVQARPEKMQNYANEGFAAHTTATECVDKVSTETTRFLWADDGGADKISLRGAVSVKDVACGPEGSGEGSSSSDRALTPGAIAGIVLAVLAGLGALFAAAAGPLTQWAAALKR